MLVHFLKKAAPNKLLNETTEAYSLVCSYRLFVFVLHSYNYSNTGFTFTCVTEHVKHNTLTLSFEKAGKLVLLFIVALSNSLILRYFTNQEQNLVNTVSFKC